MVDCSPQLFATTCRTVAAWRRLEELLEDGAADDAPQLSSNNGQIHAPREMHARRPQQVLEALVSCLPTYRPLLLGIKAAYDRALADAAESAADHAQLCLLLSAVEHQRVSVALGMHTSHGCLQPVCCACFFLHTGLPAECASVCACPQAEAVAAAQAQAETEAHEMQAELAARLHELEEQASKVRAACVEKQSICVPGFDGVGWMWGLFEVWSRVPCVSWTDCGRWRIEL